MVRHVYNRMPSPWSKFSVFIKVLKKIFFVSAILSRVFAAFWAAVHWDDEFPRNAMFSIGFLNRSIILGTRCSFDQNDAHTRDKISLTKKINFQNFYKYTKLAPGWGHSIINMSNHPKHLKMLQKSVYLHEKSSKSIESLSELSYVNPHSRHAYRGPGGAAPARARADLLGRARGGAAARSGQRWEGWWRAV